MAVTIRIQEAEEPDDALASSGLPCTCPTPGTSSGGESEAEPLTRTLYPPSQPNAFSLQQDKTFDQGSTAESQARSEEHCGWLHWPRTLSFRDKRLRG